MWKNFSNIYGTKRQTIPKIPSIITNIACDLSNKLIHMDTIPNIRVDIKMMKKTINKIILLFFLVFTISPPYFLIIFLIYFTIFIMFKPLFYIKLVTNITNYANNNTFL